MPHEVFICYASRDKAVAEAVCTTLESRHIRCWIAPRDVLPGTEWAETIVDALDESRLLVLVLSSSSNTSPQVIREVGRAASNGIPIIPFRIDDVTPSKAMDFFVSSHHWLDALTPPLEKHLQRLADTVQQILARKRAPKEVIEIAEAEEKAKREAEEAKEKAKREAELAAKEKREAKEARKAKEVEERAREKAKREAEEAAKEKAKREAELAAKEKREAEEVREKARREAEEARKAKERRAEPVKVKPLLKRWWLWAGVAAVLVVLIFVFQAPVIPSLFPPPLPEEEVPPPPPPPAKDKIVIGAARPLSGLSSIYEEVEFGPIYKMWVEEVNTRGGIYVEEYGKKLPIELIIYDDKSDLDTMMSLLEKLMVEDKVDFVLSPASTDFIYAAAPIFNKYGYILMGAEGGSTSIREIMPGLPYVFMPLNFSDHNQVPVLADLLEELGVETAAIIFVDEPFGVEYSGVAITEFDNAGIEVAMSKSVPIEVDDVSLLLLEAQDKGVDALCVFAYPPQCFLTVGTAIAMGINFDALLLGPGGCFAVFPGAFGPAVEGVMALGAWNEKSSPAAAEFANKFLARYDEGILDYWRHLTYWGGLQFFEQAIEKAGTLDQAVIRDVMATETFNTCLGPTWFEGGLLAVECYPGQIGQWQSGVFEVIDPGEKRTAEPIYPKPEWPSGTPSARLLYEDDFSNPTSGWPRESKKTAELRYEDGEYHILVKESNWVIYVWNWDAEQFTDFALEIDARLVSGPTRSAYGLIFRLQPKGDNYYRFLVSGDGYYLVEKRLNGMWTELQGWTESTFIKQGNSTNHLKVVCQGTQIEVYVNGHYLTTLTDDSFAEGCVGVIVNTSEPNARVAFDNIKVYSLD